jgi:hypothetical protein
MQTRGAGDDPDGCDKRRFSAWSFSGCIFSYLGEPHPTTRARERLIELYVSDPHFIAVRRNEIAHLLAAHQNGKPPQTQLRIL